MPFLPVIFLPKLPSMDLQTIPGFTECLIHNHDFHTAWLLIMELTLQQKYSKGPICKEFTGLIMYPTILKQLACQNGGMAL